MVLGLYVLSMLARPFTRYRAVLLLAMIGLFVGGLAVPMARDFFILTLPAVDVLFSVLGVAAVGCIALELAVRSVHRWTEHRAATASPRFLNVRHRINVAIAIVARARKYP